MSEPTAYEDAVDVLDADHKAVKKLFMQFDALCEDDAPADAKGALAQRICGALKVHSQIEEEIFYPAVRAATGDGALMDAALHEHAEAKAVIERIEAMKPADADYDATVKQLAKLIDAHVLEEREQIFLEARNAALDLRGMAPPLVARKQQLTKKQPAAAAAPAARKEVTA